LQQYPWLQEQGRQIDSRFRKFQIVMVCKDIPRRKQRHIRHDVHLQQFLMENNYKWADNYVRVNPRPLDVLGEFLKYPDADRTLISDVYLDIIYDWQILEFFPWVADSQIQTQELSIKETVSKNGKKITGGPYLMRDDLRTKKLFCTSKEGLAILKTHYDNPYPTISSMCGKAECKELQKALDDKLRSFIVSSIELVVNFGCYVNDFNEKLNRHVGKHPAFMGFNPWGGGWNEFIRKQVWWKNQFWSIDFKAKDSRLFEQFAQLEFRMRCLALKLDCKMRGKCACELCKHFERFQYYWRDNWCHLVWVEGVLAVKTAGNSTGSKITIQMNTFDSYNVHSYCFIRYQEDRGQLVSYDIYKNFIKPFIQGDDALVWSSLNMMAVYQYARELGAIITIESETPRSLLDCTFLSMTTQRLWIDGQYWFVPIFSEDKLRGTWCHGDIYHQGKPLMRKSFLRTAELQKLSYFHTTLYHQQQQYLILLSNNDTITGDYTDEFGLTWSKIRSAWFQSDQIKELYIGRSGANIANCHEFRKIINELKSPSVQHGIIFKLESSRIKLSCREAALSVDKCMRPLKNGIRFLSRMPESCLRCFKGGSEVSPQEASPTEEDLLYGNILYTGNRHQQVGEYSRIITRSVKKRRSSEGGGYCDDRRKFSGEEGIAKTVQSFETGFQNGGGHVFADGIKPVNTAGNQAIKSEADTNDLAMLAAPVIGMAGYYGAKLLNRNYPGTTAGLKLAAEHPQITANLLRRTFFKSNKERKQAKWNREHTRVSRHDVPLEIENFRSSERHIQKPGLREGIEENPGYPMGKPPQKWIKKEEKKIEQKTAQKVIAAIKQRPGRGRGGFRGRGRGRRRPINMSRVLDKMGVTRVRPPMQIKGAFNPNSRKFKQEDTCVTSGLEFVQVATDTKDAPRGTVLCMIKLNPSLSNVVKLQNMATWYSNFAYLEAEIIVEAGRGSNQVGALIGYWDKDMDIDPTNSPVESLYRNAVNHQNHIFSLSKSMHFKCPRPIVKTPLLFCDYNNHDAVVTTQALFMLLVSTPNPDASFDMNVMIRYRIKFHHPQTPMGTNQAVAPAGVMQIQTAVAGAVANAFFYVDTAALSTYLVTSTLGLQIYDDTNAGYFTFIAKAPGKYWVFAHVAGTGITALSCSAISNTIGNFASNTLVWNTIIAAGTSAQTMHLIKIAPGGPPEGTYRFRLGGTYTTTTLTSHLVFYSPYDANTNPTLEFKNLKSTNKKMEYLFDKLMKSQALPELKSELFEFQNSYIADKINERKERHDVAELPSISDLFIDTTSEPEIVEIKEEKK